MYKSTRKADAYFGSFDTWDKKDTDDVIDSVRNGKFVSIVVHCSKTQFEEKTKDIKDIVSELVNYSLMYGRDFVIQHVVEEL